MNPSSFNWKLKAGSTRTSLQVHVIDREDSCRKDHSETGEGHCREVHVYRVCRHSFGHHERSREDIGVGTLLSRASANALNPTVSFVMCPVSLVSRQWA